MVDKGQATFAWRESRASHDGLTLKSTIGSKTNCTAHRLNGRMYTTDTYGVSFVSWDGGGRGHTVPVLCFWCSQMVEGGFVEPRVMLSSSHLEVQMLYRDWDYSSRCYSQFYRKRYGVAGEDANMDGEPGAKCGGV